MNAAHDGFHDAPPVATKPASHFPALTMPLITNFRYRPEIDGLRGIAVLAVVLYHAGLFCAGGYVGVDVFFVISGFLIISLIWKDLESDKFTFAHFWERRARRIVPAVAVVTIAVLIAGWFILLPEDFMHLGWASAMQAVFAANIYYWHHTGYFATPARLQPLLHTWSLSVEEKFYLFAPLLLWAIFRFRVFRQRAWVLTILSAGFVLSLALSIWGVAHHPVAAFYLLPTRAWELLLGALAAFVPLSAGKIAGRTLRELMSLVGLGLILAAICLYTPSTPFPGLAALVPCLGTALIIWANGPSVGDRLTLVGRALSNRPLVFVGLISYSLYLWHWPLLAFSRYFTLGSLSVGFRLVLIALAFILAILSWKWVEMPFRERKLGATRKSVFTWAGASLAAIGVMGVVCFVAQGFPARLPPQAAKYVRARSDVSFRKNMSTAEVRAGNLVMLGVSNPALPPVVLVWGDSHAMAALPAFDAWLKEKGLTGRAATHSFAAPLLGWFKKTKFGLNHRIVAFNNAVLDYIRRHHIPNVVLAAYWLDYGQGYGHHSTAFNTALVTTIRKLVAAGSQPWLLLDVPKHPFDIPRALARMTYTDQGIQALNAIPTLGNQWDNIDPAVIARIKAAGARILNPKPYFLDPTGQYYIIERHGIALYCDTNHLTTAGAKLILLPFLRDHFHLSPNHMIAKNTSSPISPLNAE